MARMDQAGRLQPSASPTIMAAIDDLKSALRSGAETWSEADVQEIADVIEAAAGRIRKLRDAARKPSKP